MKKENQTIKKISIVGKGGRCGQTMLSLSFLIGIVSLLVATVLALISSSFINSSYGFVNSQKALLAAQSGINDITLRIARNKDLASGIYTTTVGATTATVVLTNNNASTGQVTIDSTASILSFTRTAHVVATLSSSTGAFVITQYQIL